MKSFVAVFDNAPLGVTPWMREAAKAGGLALVDQEDVGRWLAEQPEFGKAVMDPKIKNFSNPDPSLAPYYLQVLDTKVPEARVALQGWGWLVYSPRVDVVILDTEGLEQARQSAAERVGKKRAEDEFLKVKTFMLNEAKKRVPMDRILQLQGLAPREKGEHALRFMLRHAK